MDDADYSEEDIKQQLAALGFRHISEQRLREFKRDFDELVRHEKSKSRASSDWSSAASHSSSSPPPQVKEKVHLNVAPNRNYVPFKTTSGGQQSNIFSSTFHEDDHRKSDTNHLYDSYSCHVVAQKPHRPLAAHNRLEIEEGPLILNSAADDNESTSSGRENLVPFGRYMKRNVLRKRQGQSYVCDESIHSEVSGQEKCSAVRNKMYEASTDSSENENKDDEESLSSSFYTDEESEVEDRELVKKRKETFKKGHGNKEPKKVLQRNLLKKAENTSEEMEENEVEMKRKNDGFSIFDRKTEGKVSEETKENEADGSEVLEEDENDEEEEEEIQSYIGEQGKTDKKKSDKEDEGESEKDGDDETDEVEKGKMDKKQREKVDDELDNEEEVSEVVETETQSEEEDEEESEVDEEQDEDGEQKDKQSDEEDEEDDESEQGNQSEEEEESEVEQTVKQNEQDDFKEVSEADKTGKQCKEEEEQQNVNKEEVKNEVDKTKKQNSEEEESEVEEKQNEEEENEVEEKQNEAGEEEDESEMEEKQNKEEEVSEVDGKHNEEEEVSEVDGKQNEDDDEEEELEVDGKQSEEENYEEKEECVVKEKQNEEQEVSEVDGKHNEEEEVCDMDGKQNEDDDEEEELEVDGKQSEEENYEEEEECVVKEKQNEEQEVCEVDRKHSEEMDDDDEEEDCEFWEKQSEEEECEVEGKQIEENEEEKSEFEKLSEEEDEEEESEVKQSKDEIENESEGEGKGEVKKRENQIGSPSFKSEEENGNDIDIEDEEDTEEKKRVNETANGHVMNRKKKEGERRNEEVRGYFEVEKDWLSEDSQEEHEERLAEEDEDSGDESAAHSKEEPEEEKCEENKEEEQVSVSEYDEDEQKGKISFIQEESPGHAECSDSTKTDEMESISEEERKDKTVQMDESLCFVDNTASEEEEEKCFKSDSDKRVKTGSNTEKVKEDDTRDYLDLMWFDSEDKPQSETEEVKHSFLGKDSKWHQRPDNESSNRRQEEEQADGSLKETVSSSIISETELCHQDRTSQACNEGCVKVSIRDPSQEDDCTPVPSWEQLGEERQKNGCGGLDVEKVTSEDLHESLGSPAASILTSGYGTYRPDSSKGDPEESDYRDDCTLEGLEEETEYNLDLRDYDNHTSPLWLMGQASQESLDRNAPGQRIDGKRGHGQGGREDDDHQSFEKHQNNEQMCTTVAKQPHVSDHQSCSEEGDYQVPQNHWDSVSLRDHLDHPFNLRHRKGQLEHILEENLIQEKKPQKGKRAKALSSSPVGELEEHLDHMRIGTSRSYHDTECEDTGSSDDRSCSDKDDSLSALEDYSKCRRRANSEAEIQTRPKSFIRPVFDHPNTRNWKKSDPVARYFQYKQEWETFKPPGEKSRKELRWAIREQLVRQLPPQKSQKTYTANNYVPPNEKKRSALRWDIRHDLTHGLN